MNEPRVPEAIDLQQKWRLGDQLGAGGFADVYRARSGNGTSAVVKFVRKLPGTHRELLFVDLDDVPNVAPISDWGELDDYWVLVMPEAEKSLRDHLPEVKGRLDASDAVPILVDVAPALVAMEDCVVHRDIKPENILLLDGRWCLADFGIARYTEATTAPDTLKYSMSRAYAAPEQWRGERASSATDVYTLGVVAYELLAGRLPFQGVDLRQQHLEETPVSGDNVPHCRRPVVGKGQNNRRSAALSRRGCEPVRPCWYSSRLDRSGHHLGDLGFLVSLGDIPAVTRSPRNGCCRSSWPRPGVSWPAG